MIRPMQENEIHQVMDIWLTSTIKAHPFIEEKYWLKHYRTVKNKYLKVAKTFVAEEDGVLVGFISILNEDFIGGLFVIPGRQGHTIGSALLAKVQEIYPSLRAHAYEKNPRAVRFYKRHGFEVTGQQNNLDSSFSEYVLDWKK